MHILMTADTIGGVWPYTLELAGALAALGVETTIATLGRRPTEAQRTAARAVPGLHLIEADFRLPWMADPWSDVAAAGRWLLGLADQVHPDLVHLSEPVYAALPWDVPAVAVAHSCVLSWWEAVHGEPAPPAWRRYQRAMRDGFAAAALTIAPSSFMRLAIQRHYGATARVIPNGRDPTARRPWVKEPVVFAAGRLWDQAKNIGALAVAAQGLAWPTYVAGAADHPDGLGPGRPAGVRLLGEIAAAEVAEWQARASIYALPARYEPFGLSILEAALAGCALVVGDLPSLRELWDDVALFVDPDDPSALHAALEVLIADAALRHSLAGQARRRACRLTPERMAEAYLAAYTSLLRPEVPCAS